MGADEQHAPRRPRVVLVIKRSAYRVRVEEQRDERIVRLLAAQDATVSQLRAAHEAHEATVREVEAALEAVGAEVVAVRRAGEGFDDRGLDLVVTVGGDGKVYAFAVGCASGGVTCTPLGSAPVNAVSAPALASGYVYVGTGDGKVVALKSSTRNGQPKIQSVPVDAKSPAAQMTRAP